MNERVPVPREVFEGIEAVRRSGLTNMLDRPLVAAIAEEMGYHEAARWVDENRALYSQAVFNGFEVIADPPENVPGQDQPAHTEPNDNPGG